MNHYWTASDPVALRQAQIEDWLEDLIEFGPQIVEFACREWRRRPDGKRPTPGAIRALCIEEQHNRRESNRLKALPPPQRVKRQISEEDRREARALVDRRLRERGYRGYEDLDAYLAAGGSAAELAGLPKAPKAKDVRRRPEYRPTAEQLAAGRQALVEQGYISGEGESA